MTQETVVTNIVARSDFSDLIGDLTKVSSRLSVLQSQLTTTNRALANQAAQMQKSFANTLRSTGQFSTHFVSLASDVDKFGKSLDSGKMKLGQYYGAWKDHSRTAGGLIRDLAKQQVMMQNAVLQPLGKNAQGLMQFNVHVPQGLDEVANRTKIASQELKIMNKVIQDGANQVINWGKNTQWAGRQLTMGLTLPIVAFGASAQKAFLEADQQLVRLTKVYGGVAQTSSAELKKIRAEVSATARELASAYGASYKDTISLAADIAATGKQGNELLKSTAETTRLSILGEVDRQEAMKATLAIQTAFKQNTTELGESINFLNAVENQTSTSLADLVEAIPKAGPVIQAMGGSIKDLALYMTAMKEGGINASEGANAIKSALASLINPTKVAKEMFQGFGIDLGGIVTKNAGNLTGTILELQSALDSLNPLQKQQAIEQLFGKFQFARMNALFSNLGKQGSQTLQVLDLMKASSKDLANIASREMTAMTESASGKYKRALETLKADMAGVGDQFLNVSTKLINVVDKVINFFNNLPKPLKSVLTFVAGLTAIAGPIIMLTGLLANFFGYIAKGIFHFKAFLKGGEGFKLLTPEILAAEKAGNLMETTFYNDAKAASVLKKAIANLTAELSLLETKANSATVAVGPAIQTSAGAPIKGLAGSDVIVNKNHPLVGQPYTRQMAHFVPAGTDQPGTIFGVVPNPGPVNQKISKNLQMYAPENMPMVPGLSSIRGVNTGIIPAEAAKWHSMVGALAMQSQSEIKLLKSEVNATKTITTELSTSYQALLPEMTRLTSLAASESAIIVGELEAGKITVDAAKARITTLNLEIERMMGQAATAVATAQGRTINLTTVPLTGQPSVTPTGKSNMKELFHKGPTASLVDTIARNLGVRTSGAGYSRETTFPRVTVAPFLKRERGGDIYDPRKHGATVPGSTSITYDNTMSKLPLGGFVLSQGPSLDPRNKDIVNIAHTGTTGGSSGTVDAITTPGETVYTPEVLSANPGLRETLVRVNNGYAYGGDIVSSKPNYGFLPPVVRAFTRTSGQLKVAGNSISRWLLENSSGTNKSQQVKTLLSSHQLGKPILNEKGIPYTEAELIAMAANPNKHLDVATRHWQGLLERGHAVPQLRIPDSKQYITPSVMLAQLKNGPGGNRDLGKGKTEYSPADVAKSLTDSPVHPMSILHTLQKDLGYGSDTQNLVKAYNELIARMTTRTIPFDQSKGSVNTYEHFAAGILKPYLKSIKNKERSIDLWDELMSMGTLRGPEGGKSGSLGFVTNVQHAPVTNKERFMSRWKRKENSYQVNRFAKLYNTDPHEGPLFIGNAKSISGDLTGNIGKNVYYNDKFGNLAIEQGLPSGSREEVAKYVARTYMQGNKKTLERIARERAEGVSSHPLSLQSIMKTLDKKFTGNLYRGVPGSRLEDSFPKNVAEAIKLAQATGDASGLKNLEFVLRRSSFSADPYIAKFFTAFQKDGVMINASVLNRNVTPLSEIHPDLKFSAPSGQTWGSKLNGGMLSEQESLMGGKFKIIDFKDGVLKVQSISGIEPREKGGPVNSGQTYLVGEKGPELFVPKNAGGIISNYQLGGMIRNSKYVYGSQGKYPVVESAYTSISQAEKAIRNAGNPLSVAAAQKALARLQAANAPVVGPRAPINPGPMSVEKIPFTSPSGVRGNAYAPAGSLPNFPVPFKRTLYATEAATEATAALNRSIKQLVKISKDNYAFQKLKLNLEIENQRANMADRFARRANLENIKRPSKVLTQGTYGASYEMPKTWKELLFSSKGLRAGLARPLDQYGKPIMNQRKGFSIYNGMGGIGSSFSNHPMATTLALSAAGTYAGQKVAEKNQTLGNVVSTVTGILPFLLMGKMQAAQGAKSALMSQAAQNAGKHGNVAKEFARLKDLQKAEKIAGQTGKSVTEAQQLMKEGKAGRAVWSAKTAAVASKGRVLGKAAFNLGVLAKTGQSAVLGSNPIGWVIEGTLLAAQSAWIYKRHVEDIGKANRAVFGPTKESLKEVGLEYKSITDKVKEVNKAQRDFAERVASSGKNSKGKLVGGLTLTKDQVESEVKRIQDSKSETVQDFNKTYGKQDVLRLAVSLKQQYISAGMSASEATNKVYTFIKASNKASYAFAAITQEAFKGLADQGQAADYAVRTVVKSLSSAEPEELARGVQNIVSSLDGYRDGLVGTKDVNGEIIDEYKAQQMALDKIIALKGTENALGKDTVDEIKKQDLYLGSVINKADSLQSIYAKSALLQGGYGNKIDIAGLNPTDSVKAAQGMEIWRDAVDETVISASGLAKEYNGLEKAVTKASKAQVDPAVQKALEKKIKLQDDLIQKIKDEADARIKALDAEQASADFTTNLRKEQLAYQNAVAAGDMSGAAQAQLNIQALVRSKQIADAKQAITDKANADMKKAEVVKKGYQDTITKNADAVESQQLNAQKQANDYAALDSYFAQVSSLVSQLTPDSFNPDSKDKNSPSYLAMEGIKVALQDLAESGSFGKAKAAAIQKTIDASTTKSGRVGTSAFITNMLGASSTKAKELDTTAFDSAITAFTKAVNIFAKTQGFTSYLAPEKGQFHDNGAFGPSTTYEVFHSPDNINVKIQIKANSHNYEDAFNAAMEKGWVFEKYAPNGLKELKGKNTYHWDSLAGTRSKLPEVPAKAMGGTVNGYAPGGKPEGTYIPGLGGYVRGAGTPTSDSILTQMGSGGFARLSDTEYVQPASAVAYYGTDVMEKIRSRSIPREALERAIGGTVNGYAAGGKVKDGWLQKWAKNISGQPAAEMFGTAQLLRLIAGLGSKGDALGAAQVPLAFLGSGLGPKIAGNLGKTAFAIPNKLYQLRNQAKVNSMIKSGMWHGSQPVGHMGEDYLQGTNILEGAESYDPYYGMGFFSTTSKREADSYAAGHNSLSNWGEAYGSMNQVIHAPRGKYIDFTRGTNSLKWQDYSLAKALGVKRNGYLGNFMPENMGDIMNREGMTGAIMNRIRAGRSPLDSENPKWLSWSNPAGVITTENYAMGGAIPGYVWGGGAWKQFKNFLGNAFNPLGQGYSSFHSGMAAGVAQKNYAMNYSSKPAPQSPAIQNPDPKMVKWATGEALASSIGESTLVPSAYRLLTGNSHEIFGHKSIGVGLDALGAFGLGAIAKRGITGFNAARTANQAAKAAELEARLAAIEAAKPENVAARIKAEIQASLANVPTPLLSSKTSIIDPYKGKVGSYGYPSREDLISQTLRNQPRNIEQKFAENILNSKIKMLRAKMKATPWAMTPEELEFLFKNGGLNRGYIAPILSNDPYITTTIDSIRSTNKLSPLDPHGFDTTSNLYSSKQSLEDLLKATLYHGGQLPEHNGTIMLDPSKANPSNWFGAPFFATEGRNQALSYLIKNLHENPSLYKVQSNLKPHEVLDLRHGAEPLSKQNPFILGRLLAEIRSGDLKLKSRNGEGSYWTKDRLYEWLIAQENGESAELLAPGVDRLRPFLQIDGLSQFLKYEGIKGIAHRGGTVLKTPEVFGKDINSFKNINRKVDLVNASPLVKGDLSTKGHDVLAYTTAKDSIASIQKSTINRDSLAKMLTNMDKRGWHSSEMEQIIEQILMKAKGKGFQTTYAIGGSLSGMNIPKFEDGINMVPADMLAMIHKNEAVVPANMNPFNPNANASFGERVYHIAPVIHAAQGMDENAIADIATRKMLDQLKRIQYNESRTNGMGRSF